MTTNGTALYRRRENSIPSAPNRCQIYNKKFIVTTIAEQSFFSPEQLLKHAPMLTISSQPRLHKTACWA